MRLVLIIMMGVVLSGLAWGIENGNSYSWVRQPSSGSSSDFCSGGVCTGNLTVAPYNVSAYYGWFDFLCLTSDTCISAWPAGGTDLWNTSAEIQAVINESYNVSYEDAYTSQYNVTAYGDAYNVSYTDIYALGYNVSYETLYLVNTTSDMQNAVNSLLADINSTLYGLNYNVSYENLNNSMIDFVTTTNISMGLYVDDKTSAAAEDFTDEILGNYSAVQGNINDNITMLQLAMMNNLSSTELNGTINDRWAVNYNISMEETLSSLLVNGTIIDVIARYYNVSLEDISSMTLINNTINDRWGINYNVSYEETGQNAYLNGTINDRWGANHNTSWEQITSSNLVNITIKDHNDSMKRYVDATILLDTWNSTAGNLNLTTVGMRLSIMEGSAGNFFEYGNTAGITLGIDGTATVRYAFNTNVSATTGMSFNSQSSQIEINRGGTMNFAFNVSADRAGQLTLKNITINDRDGGIFAFDSDGAGYTCCSFNNGAIACVTCTG